MTRHELKEQIQHDPFAEAVARVVDYTTTNRQAVIRWVVIAVAVAAVIGGIVWYSSYARSVRQRDLDAAFQVLSAPVGPQQPQFGKSFPTEDAKKQASIKAFAAVVAKDGDSREGLIARYYLASIKAQQDARAAEADLKTVADSRSEVSALAKIALAQLYAGENRVPEAQQLLRDLVNKPTDLVSKQQAQVMLAQLDQATNPQQAEKILKDLRTESPRPAVSRAVDQLSAQLGR
ncbi:MAG: tetratricopeptide repeat protein [Acidobacteriaceae bacterium]|nr:tetratricopeptide repeat protein [Acidobacteriaceae bacterium]